MNNALHALDLSNNEDLFNSEDEGKVVCVSIIVFIIVCVLFFFNVGFQNAFGEIFCIDL